MNTQDYNLLLKDAGLKVTPQRVAVLKVLIDNDRHPSAEEIIKSVLDEHPSISVGTIYNILDTFVEKELIVKIQTKDSVMRYDPIVKVHHHIYLTNNEIIDYFDDKLTSMVKEYLVANK
ncbi:MAG TPA: transcriptional repressor, partial [Saprospiraceae bacterium]|nr:transcriptional repressor [Saprospiraceae bacterium]